jgi:hypothetical protein
VEVSVQTKNGGGGGGFKVNKTYLKRGGVLKIKK